MTDDRLDHDKQTLARPELEVARREPLPGQALLPLDRHGWDLVTSRPLDPGQEARADELAAIESGRKAPGRIKPKRKHK